MSTTNSQQVFSKTEDFLKGQSLKYSDKGDQLLIDVCPFQKCVDHLYVAKGGNKDGLFDCKKCGESGNLTKLMAAYGVRNDGILSMRGAGEKEQIPNVEAAHRLLMEDEDVLEYLVGERKYSVKVIEQQKLGVIPRRYMKDCGEVKVLMMPHINNGQVVWAKYRTLPPTQKQFGSPTGWDATLYNEQCITKNMPELILVEGEGNVLTLMSQGIEYAVGVPGANTKKMEWIAKLDELKPQKMYILYDSDKVGQRAAQEIAKRIGIDKVLKIVLPPFLKEDGTPGKDINEWFRMGHTLEEFEQLKQNAKLFDVEGVQNVVQTLDDLEQQILIGGGLKPTYTTPWKALDDKLGGCEPGDVIDIIAEGKVGKTTLLLNWLDFYAAQGHSCFLYCLEMSNARMGRKWVSMVTQTDDSPGNSQITVDTVRAAKGFARERDGELLFGSGRVNKAEDAFETVRQVVRRYGCKFVGFDNIQMLCDLTLTNQNARTIHLSQISKKWKELAMELGIVLFRIIQPNKVREGEIVSNRNVDGSSQVEKDCDAMIAAHRNKKMQMKKSDTEAIPFVDEVSAFEPTLYLNVCLARYAPGGITTLKFDGATSTVREFDGKEMMSALQGKPIVGMAVREEQRAPAEA
jgi:replicative DNA helicase